MKTTVLAFVCGVVAGIIVGGPALAQPDSPGFGRSLWIYYRLAPVSDAVLAAIVNAVRHALTHSEVVQRDARRLQRKTGCCLPSSTEVNSQPCCAPSDTGAPH
jgi:hypothetical protein